MREWSITVWKRGALRAVHTAWFQSRTRGQAARYAAYLRDEKNGDWFDLEEC